MELYEIS